MDHATTSSALPDNGWSYHGWGPSGPEYRPRSAADTVVHELVVEHLETFLQEARSRDGGSGVPKFVERAFRKLIECGCLARGFARVRCTQCGFDRLVPFSCKVRGLCSSCAGRRMAELSAHLLDEVIPIVPVRQWVLTFPHPLRYILAWNHELTREVLALFNQTLAEFYVNRAEARGLRESRTGTVTAIQRVGSALNLNPHFHTLSLDGVFTLDSDGHLGFQPDASPTDEDVAEVLATIRRRAIRLLAQNGILDEDCSSFQFDELSDRSLSLASIYSAGVQGRVALGQRSGRKVMRIGAEPESPWVTSRAPLQAHLEGFDLHAGVSVDGERSEQRDSLERLCRYVLRPPVAQERLELMDDGRILLKLRTPFWDGTTHLVFEPLELLEKLAALIPRPRTNQLIYSGVLGPNASWRRDVVAFGREQRPKNANARSGDAQADTESSPKRRKSYTWAELMARVFLIDVLKCPRCLGRMKVIATIEEPRVVRKILSHLELPTEMPSFVRARASPELFDDATYC